MNKDESNRKLAEWLGVPCWHENSQTWAASPCKHCGLDPSYAASRSDIPEQSELSYWNPNYYTPEGFLALLDGLRAKGLNWHIQKQDSSETVTLWEWRGEWPVAIGKSQESDLPTALVEAALQAMEVENG